MARVLMTVNGEAVAADIAPRVSLADFLRRDLGLTGTHLGCEHGVCGACTVHVDGAPTRSCIALAVSCDGAAVRTVEGFDNDAVMTALRTAFKQHHALQCGYCTPGMLMTAYDIVGRLPGASEARIREELSGNLCRCTGYLGIVAAIGSVAARQSNQPHPEPDAVAPVLPPPAPFTPRGGGKVPATSTVLAADQDGDLAWAHEPEDGQTRLCQSFALTVAPDEAWSLLSDVERVAPCLPGASASLSSDGMLSGAIAVKFGPLTASFTGDGKLQRDDVAKVATITGEGQDNRSRTRAKGRMAYRVAAAAGGGSKVDVVLDFQLAGLLAQFSRGGLIAELADGMTRQFAANLSAMLDPSAPSAAPSQPPSAVGGGFVIGSLWRWLRGFFRR